MTKYPYPIDLNSVSLDRYLTNLLSALVKKAGGTLHIAVADILNVQDQVLLRYPNRNMSEIVLQLAPGNTDMYVVPEAPSWQAVQPAKPSLKHEVTPVQPPSPPQPVPTRTPSTLDNLSLYLKEQEREEKLREIQQEDELEERRRIGLSPFRTVPNK